MREKYLTIFEETMLNTIYHCLLILESKQFTCFSFERCYPQTKFHIPHRKGYTFTCFSFERCYPHSTSLIGRAIHLPAFHPNGAIHIPHRKVDPLIAAAPFPWCTKGPWKATVPFYPQPLRLILFLLKNKLIVECYLISPLPLLQ